jgi:ribosomal protein S21|tara:strand:- start:434 stop:691 length:258 start_codon:yes stop_codon:yes gene_type:complete
MKIYVKNNDVSRALKVLKKKQLAEGDLKEMRKREFFVPTGEQNRIDAKAGRKRWDKKRKEFVENIEKREQLLIKANRRASQRRRK